MSGAPSDFAARLERAGVGAPREERIQNYLQPPQSTDDIVREVTTAFASEVARIMAEVDSRNARAWIVDPIESVDTCAEAEIAKLREAMAKAREALRGAIIECEMSIRRLSFPAQQKMRAAITAIDTLTTAPPPRRVRHVKRGSSYRVIGSGPLQTSRPVSEGEPITIYRCEQDGSLWPRPSSEFEDGRFVELSPNNPEPSA